MLYFLVNSFENVVIVENKPHKILANYLTKILETTYRNT